MTRRSPARKAVAFRRPSGAVARPGAEGALRRRERRACDRAPGVRRWVVGGPVVPGVAAAAAAPADQLAARPDGDALAGRRLRQRVPAAGGRVERGLAAAPE